MSIQNILTQKKIKEDEVVQKKRNFYIPANSVFIWFVPDGNYILSVNLKNNKNKQNRQFKGKEFSVYGYNINFNIW